MPSTGKRIRGLVKVGVSGVSHHCSRMIGLRTSTPWLLIARRGALTTAGAFERRETIFEMLSELIPRFRAPRATALPSCTDCGGRDPGSEALAGILLRTGTSAPARHPCTLTGWHYHSEIPDLRPLFLHGNVLSTLGVFDGEVSCFDVRMHNARIILEFAGKE